MCVLLCLDRIVLLQLANVSSSDEGLLPRTGEDHDAYFAILFQISKGIPQFAHCRHVQGVKDLRTIDGDISDIVLLLEDETFKSHSKFSITSSKTRLGSRHSAYCQSLTAHRQLLTASPEVDSSDRSSRKILCQSSFRTNPPERVS